MSKIKDFEEGADKPVRPYTSEGWVILNYLGQLWSPSFFKSKADAVSYHKSFWDSISYSSKNPPSFVKVVASLHIDEILDAPEPERNHGEAVTNNTTNSK